LTAVSLAGEGYLNFMGNDFGHPEWIDFPREGNGNSFHYCRRQWSLADAPHLQYRHLLAFDKAMLSLSKGGFFGHAPEQLYVHNEDKLLVYRRGDLLFALNFHTFATHTVPLPLSAGTNLTLVLDSAAFGEENPPAATALSPREGENGAFTLSLTIPARTALVYRIKR
ncbi:MAG: alpha amylase C-terminal domain-containing protein, partial [Clostridia bacterium]|nr:alpha amylase C-terminal domain-containing protein [Clostridia bacterium]